MARSKISSPTRDIITDDGSVLLSVVQGEQPHLEFTIGWLTNMTNFNVHARLIEGSNDWEGTKPTSVKTGGVKLLLSKDNGFIRGVNDGDNKFTVVIPYNVSAGMLPQPTPNKPVYMFIDLEIGEPGTGSDMDPIGEVATPDKQIWKPVRGLVEVVYSPTEGV